MTTDDTPFIPCGNTEWGTSRPCALEQGHPDSTTEPGRHVPGDLLDTVAKTADRWGFPRETIEDAQFQAWLNHCQRHWREKVSPKFRDANLDTIDQPVEILDAIDEWRPPSNLILLGPVGVGKTHLAHAVARRQFIAGNLSFAITSSGDYLAALRPDGEPDANIRQAPTCDLLVFDDLGAEKPSEWVDEQIFRLFDARWRNELPTIITTNLDPAQLRDAIGERCWSRIRHNAVILRLTGQDRRKAKAA